MNGVDLYRFLADTVLIVHVAIVAFVVGGLALILLGNLCRWQWVNTVWFRIAHLAAIAIVVAEAWFDIVCPLTSLELWLRVQAGIPGYTGSFVGHWLQRLLYYDAPAWAFTLTYTLFGLAVAATWWRYPPRKRAPDL